MLLKVDLLCLAIDFLSRDDLDVLEITCVTLRDIVRKHYSLEPYRHFLRLDVRGDTSTLIGQDHTGVFNQTKLWHYKYIDDLCQRLRHSVVDFADFSNIQVFDDNLLEGLLPARSTWSKGTCRTADNFSSPEVLERAFNELFFCQEMLLGIQERVFTLSQSILSFPCVRQCHRLEIWHAPYPYTKEDIVNWLNEDTAFGNDKTVRILPSGFGYTGNIEELVEYFKEDFAQASSPHRYEMQIILKKSCGITSGIDEVLSNEHTSEEMRLLLSSPHRFHQATKLVVQRKPKRIVPYRERTNVQDKQNDECVAENEELTLQNLKL